MWVFQEYNVKKKQSVQKSSLIRPTPAHVHAEITHTNRHMRILNVIKSSNSWGIQPHSESGGGRRCFAVCSQERYCDATASRALIWGAHTLLRAHTHRGGDVRRFASCRGALDKKPVTHTTCDGRQPRRVLLLRRLISGRLALPRVSDWVFYWGILRQWWRTRPKTGRFSISKLWWVWDEVIDRALRHVSVHAGFFNGLHPPAEHCCWGWLQEETVCGWIFMYIKSW